MDKDTKRELADRLWLARENNLACPPLTETHPDITLEDAYEISDLNAGRRMASLPTRMVGKKIGLTSEAVQQQLGVSEPDFGFLTADMHLPNNSVLSPRQLIQGKAEAEVAMRLHTRLQGPNLSLDDVRAAVGAVTTCIEIIDSRVADWRIRIEDTVADNASSAYFVLGDNWHPLAEVDLVAATMTLTKNGEVVSRGSGANCLGNPLQALLWLANCLGKFDKALEADDIILTGAYGPVTDIVPGDQLVAEIDPLGSASLTI